jgi:hypothetical protein
MAMSVLNDGGVLGFVFVGGRAGVDPADADPLTLYTLVDDDRDVVLVCQATIFQVERSLRLTVALMR